MRMLKSFATAPLALALSVVLLLSISCATNLPPSGQQPSVWMTYARNVPHATQQRINMFSTSEAPAIVVFGFPAQWVVISLHAHESGRVLLQTTQYVEAHAGRAVPLKPLRPGNYVVRASQEGVLKAEYQFSVRN